MISLRQYWRNALVASIVGAAAFGSIAPVHAGSGDSKFEAALIAPAAAGDVSGKARFESRPDRSKFSVEIEGFAPGRTYFVSVNYVTVGQIVVDASGVGNLNYDSNFEPGDVTPDFPAGFPAIQAGSHIVVGPLSGDF